MLFLPLTLTVFVRIQNTIRKIKVVEVMCIMFRDKWITRFFEFPFCGDFSLHVHKMVEEISWIIERLDRKLADAISSNIVEKCDVTLSRAIQPLTSDVLRVFN